MIIVENEKRVPYLVHALLYNREKVLQRFYEQNEKTRAGYVCYKNEGARERGDRISASKKFVQEVLGMDFLSSTRYPSFFPRAEDAQVKARHCLLERQ